LPRADIRVDTSLVLVPAQVTNLFGTPITDLRKEDFKVFEDGVEQPITNFSMEDAPLSIGLLFDISGSMRNKIKKSTEAAAEFFKTSNPEDEFFLIEFSDRPKLTVPFTTDSGEVYDRIAHAKPFGRTSLLDAIHMAMLEMKHAQSAGDRFRRGRQSQPPHGARDQECHAGIGRRGLCDGDLRSR
jgi:VWFA-related protein